MAITEAVVRYLEPRLITTAADTIYAITSCQRAAPRQRHFSFENSVQTAKPQAFRDRRPVKDSC